jgi:hypothetical protein
VPSAYTSIFSGSSVITRRELCEILNLDISRPGLKFTDAEIHKAFRIRSLRFHPDKQSANDQAIPEETCNVLMNDISIARDYLLAGKDYVPGVALGNDHLRVGSIYSWLSSVQPSDIDNWANSVKEFATSNWVDSVIGMLDGLKTGSFVISSTVPWMSFFSNTYLMMLLMSTFLDEQLNFRVINLLAKPLATIQPYLQDLDGHTLIDFLRTLKEYTAEAEAFDEEKFNVLKAILPTSISDHPQFDDLFPALLETKEELAKLLDDNFIIDLQHILQFWPHFIANVPSWKHIIGVYFTSLLLTANSLPKSINALKVITEVIWEHKGGLALALTALPLFLLTAVVLPASIIVQLSKQLAWVAMRASLQLLINGFSLLFSASNLIHSLFPDSGKSISEEAFYLFESGFNLSVRLSINVILETLNGVIFVISSQSPLSSLLETINAAFDSMLGRLPKAALIEPSAEPGTGALIVVEAAARQQPPARTQTEQPSENREPAEQSYGFFANSNLPLLNQEDLWLEKILKITAADDQPEDDIGVGVNPMRQVA